MSPGFELSSVVHLVRPTGARARDLQELYLGLRSAPLDSVFYHAHQYVLRFADADELPPNDFAAWVLGVVQDGETGERLAYASLAAGKDLAALPATLVSVLESVPERTRVTRDAPEGGEFRFHGVESVVVPTGCVANDVPELIEHLRTVEPACLFYHLVQRPLLRPEAGDTLEAWVEGQGQPRLAAILRDAPDWGLPLEQTRQQILRRWSRSQIARRLAARTRAPEVTRQREATEAVTRLVGRIRGGGHEEDAS
jgi:hypothetical protein